MLLAFWILALRPTGDLYRRRQAPWNSFTPDMEKRRDEAAVPPIGSSNGSLSINLPYLMFASEACACALTQCS